MKILDVLVKEAILVDLKAKDKIGILNELVAPAAHITGIDHNEMVRVLMERERLGSTGIGGGIGIPHGKLNRLSRLPSVTTIKTGSMLTMIVTIGVYSSPNFLKRSVHNNPNVALPPDLK